jgi:hypothetical protein
MLQFSNVHLQVQANLGRDLPLLLFPGKIDSWIRNTSPHLYVKLKHLRIGVGLDIVTTIFFQKNKTTK